MNNTPTGEVPEEIFQRIEKLLALNTSHNEHEAALALSKASEILQKYNLDMSTIRGRLSQDSVSETGSKPLVGMNGSGRFTAKADFVVILARALAQANLCRALYARYNVYFIGKTHNCKGIYILDTTSLLC